MMKCERQTECPFAGWAMPSGLRVRGVANEIEIIKTTTFPSTSGLIGDLSLFGLTVG